MTQNYRVHYKKGDVTIEVESTDKDYVDVTLKKLIDLRQASSSSNNSSQSGSARGSSSKHKSKAGKLTKDRGDTHEINISALVTAIHEADNFSQIEEHVLNKSAQLPRVLLVLHFANELGAPSLTTGQISSVTDELGVKISPANVSHTIRNNRKYFTSDHARRRGASVPCKLNRQGKQAILKCLKAEKV